MPFDEDVVEVAGLLGGELPKPEVIHDQDVPGEPAAELALERVVGARGVERVEQLALVKTSAAQPANRSPARWLIQTTGRSAITVPGAVTAGMPRGGA
jgi:hypothetical protein